MPKGTVKRFGSTRGFGLVAPDGGGMDGFVRVSAVQRAGLR
ncbi:MAG: cold-shock protein, partial [Cereibacter sp.]